MKHIFVINPMAGKGKKLPAVLSAITYACKEMEVDFQIYHTATVGDATRFVLETCRSYPDLKKRFYACGGDGTLYEVLNGAVGFDNTEITVIPLGTGNDFTKSFTHPEYFADIKRQLRGRAEKIDLLSYGNHYSINVINIGFDCDVVQRVAEIKRHVLVPSGMAYGMAIMDTFSKPFGKHFKVVIDDQEMIEGEFMLCAMANASYYGDGYLVAPRAKLDDGLMELLLVDCVSRAQFMKVIPTYKAGRHIDEEGNSKYPFVRYQRCKKVVIESKNAIGLCADGEVTPIKTEEILCVPRAISFSIPKGSVCLGLVREGKR